MIHAPVPPDAWAAEGARTAGLLDCIRDGLPISEIARPLSDDGRIFALASGGSNADERLVLESARWPRLVAGFREVDALLLIVVAANAPGLPLRVRREVRRHDHARRGCQPRRRGECHGIHGRTRSGEYPRGCKFRGGNARGASPRVDPDPCPARRGRTAVVPRPHRRVACALRLAEGMPSAQVAAAIAEWEARGISAYALLQDDGLASLLASAFETPGQSVLVALSLRDIGVEPVLAFRTGRMF